MQLKAGTEIIKASECYEQNDGNHARWFMKFRSVIRDEANEDENCFPTLLFFIFDVMRVHYAASG
jgi:hypothetical protein